MHWKARDMLTIALVNNMPAAAIPSTERHFRELLTSAAQDMPFQLRWFRLAGARPAIYERLEDLWNSEIDGLIVTGAEPRAASLSDEPLWRPLTELAEWAKQNTSSVIWSCLAAHAAVLYLDGVERRPHSEKICGIFDSVKVAEHPIVASTQSVWRVPHSRWNDLPERDLVARGYTVLAKSADAGVDTFVKQFRRSLFVFIQTHPDYDVGTLMREYRRDISRFRVDESGSYPKPPCNYFDSETAAELEAIRNDAPNDRKVKELAILERAAPPCGWQTIAMRLYRNWLSYLMMSREARLVQAV
jgi:homoserine O-succinyltransferase/O-acetyltransferase